MMFSISPLAVGSTLNGHIRITAIRKQPSRELPLQKLVNPANSYQGTDVTEIAITETKKAIPNQDGLAYCSEENCREPVQVTLLL